jgi:hypothetical protein
VDWWILEYGEHRALGAGVMTVFLALALVGATLWWRAVRRGAGAASIAPARAPPEEGQR